LIYVASSIQKCSREGLDLDAGQVESKRHGQLKEMMFHDDEKRELSEDTPA
jgi:hypothetical protein